MKRRHFSQLFGNSSFVAGLATLALALPATASNIPSANNYQIGRHGWSNPNLADRVRLTRSTSNHGIGGGTNSTESDKHQGTNNYQIGRHGMQNPSSMNVDRSGRSTSNNGIGGGTNSLESDKHQGMNNYQIGRHGMWE